MVTFVVSLLVLLLPLALIIFMTVLQIKHLLDALASGSGSFDLSAWGNSFLNWINHILAKLPGGYHITQHQVHDFLNQTLQSLARGFLNLLSSSISGISAFFVSAIIYVYLFVNILVHSDKLTSTLRNLNPLGAKASDIYLRRMGAMTSAMVRGQFVIAIVQGATSSIALWIAGLHGLFFFMLLLLTMLSIIPLGAGVVVVPVAIIMLLTGNIWGGVFVLLVHFLITNNEDNVLRPILVPKTARLNSALTILSVFAGVAMFGFIGIVIGPVVMITIVTTINMYLEERGSSSA